MATREHMPCLSAVRTEGGWAMAPCGTKERCTKPATQSSGRNGTRSIHECFQCVDDDSQLAECLQSGADTPWSSKRRKSSIRRISFCAKLSLGGLEEPKTQPNKGKETTDDVTDGIGRCSAEQEKRLDLYAATVYGTQSNKHKTGEQAEDRRKDAGVPSYFELGEDTNGTQGLPLGTPVGFQYHISDSQFKTPPVPITKQSKCRDAASIQPKRWCSEAPWANTDREWFEPNFQILSLEHLYPRPLGMLIHACNGQSSHCQKQEILQRRWTASHRVHKIKILLKHPKGHSMMQKDSPSKALHLRRQPSHPQIASEVNHLLFT